MKNIKDSGFFGWCFLTVMIQDNLRVVSEAMNLQKTSQLTWGKNMNACLRFLILLAAFLVGWGESLSGCGTSVDETRSRQNTPPRGPSGSNAFPKAFREKTGARLRRVRSGAARELFLSAAKDKPAEERGRNKWGVVYETKKSWKEGIDSTFQFMSEEGRCLKRNIRLYARVKHAERIVREAHIRYVCEQCGFSAEPVAPRKGCTRRFREDAIDWLDAACPFFMGMNAVVDFGGDFDDYLSTHREACLRMSRHVASDGSFQFAPGEDKEISNKLKMHLLSRAALPWWNAQSQIDSFIHARGLYVCALQLYEKASLIDRAAQDVWEFGLIDKNFRQLVFDPLEGSGAREAFERVSRLLYELGFRMLKLLGGEAYDPRWKKEARVADTGIALRDFFLDLAYGIKREGSEYEYMQKLVEVRVEDLGREERILVLSLLAALSEWVFSYEANCVVYEDGEERLSRRMDPYVMSALLEYLNEKSKYLAPESKYLKPIEEDGENSNHACVGTAGIDLDAIERDAVSLGPVRPLAKRTTLSNKILAELKSKKTDISRIKPGKPEDSGNVFYQKTRFFDESGEDADRDSVLSQRRPKSSLGG